MALLCGAEAYDEINPEELLICFLLSGLMIGEEGNNRTVSWETKSANLMKNRRNGRKGGRRSSKGHDSNGAQKSESKKLVDDEDEVPF